VLLVVKTRENFFYNRVHNSISTFTFETENIFFVQLLFVLNPRWFESDKIYAKALIVSEKCDQPSHFQSTKSIDAWLKEQGVTGLAGIDTRELTRILREAGSTMARIVLGEPTTQDLKKEIPDLNLRNLVAEVSPKVSVSLKILSSKT